MEYLTQSPEETRQLGKTLASSLKSKVIVLFGELGAGKTHFVQGLAQGLGIEKRVLSPTFIFIRPYTENNFYHVDLYRLEKESEISALGLEEILEEKGATIVIEWPEKIISKLKDPVKIYFEKASENERKIKV
ncbi:MAG: tRNA (adenosine(37)-N6)-threonylcarbamoyltransferase complex ATPase subunit type 1 TsaE [bacterium]|nr:tRNA (adenosine(37)-N6)-threonylcarbamoyltransferase complex ATPase subunit type 1 TsaE [bacterium]